MTRRELLLLGIGSVAARSHPLRPLVIPTGKEQRFTYYVDALGGDDSRDGRTPSSAKRTLTSIPSLKLLPGDSIGFARGSIWNEHLLISQSGRAGRPIILGAYGSGLGPVFDASEKLSWRRGGPSQTQWSCSARQDPHLLIIRGAMGERMVSRSLLRTEGQWSWDAAASQVFLYSRSDPIDLVRAPLRPHAITLEGCSYVTLKELTWRGAALDGLMVEGETNGITIDHCRGEFCVGNGAFFPGLDSPHHSGVVRGSDFCNNGASGLLVNGDFRDWLIADSIFERNALLALDDSDRHTWTAGLKLWGNRKFGAGSVIERCTASDNGCGQDDGARGLGIWVDQAVGVTVRFNSVFRNDSWGIYLEKTRNSLAHHNTVWQCAMQSKFTAGLGVKCSGSDDSIANGVYNNVIYDSGHWGLYVGSYQAMGACRLDRNRIANNIAVKAGAEVFYCDKGGDNDERYGNANEYMNNCFGSESGGFLFWGGRMLSTYEELENSYGRAMHNVQADPAFVDPRKADFRLVPSSPCRGRGLVVPNIAVAVSGSNPDVGRF